uniref:Uncharacterized protein n=1 Tax=Strombidium rassoulzadegani TaxID=1082188 RepID=A0A7S3CI24_9SPIT
MREGLVLLVHDLPLFLEGSDQLLLLVVVHEELLAVHVGLLLDLHLAHELVLVLDLSLNFLQIFGHLSVVPLLEVVFIFILGELGSGQDVLHGVRHDEVLV